MIWERLGFVRWPMAVCLLMVILFSVWAFIALARDRGQATLKTKIWIDAVGVWGFLAFLTGLLGTSVGLIFALQGIERAGAVFSREAAPGFVIATVSPTLGTAIFGAAVLCWFVLQLQWRRRQAAAET